MGWIGGIIVGFLLAALIGWFLKDEKETHWHEWRVRGAHQLMSVSTYHGVALQPAEEGRPITEVLYRCCDEDCQDVATEQLDGHWTFEQLSGVAGSGEIVEVENEVIPQLKSLRRSRREKPVEVVTDSTSCPHCPHPAHPGVDCRTSDACGCGQ